MRIFDTHAHYDSEQFDADRDALLSGMTDLPGLPGRQKAVDNTLKEDGRANETGDSWQVCAAVNVGATFEGARQSLALAHRYPGVYAACGVHPDEVGELEEDEAEAEAETEDSAEAAETEKKQDSVGTDDAFVFRHTSMMPGQKAGLRGQKEAGPAADGLPGTDRNGKFACLGQMCQDPKCVAVGEIGLDYHWMVQPKELQQRWFIRQLALSERLHLPINVHSRDAAADTFEIIKEYHAHTGEGGIIHCYSGSVEMAREYVKMGYHIGIGGVVTFKNGRVLKDVVRQIPIEWLVTETDCPYLAPEPLRGRRNDSRLIRYVVEAIAGLKEMDVREAAARLFENALQVYRL